MSSINNNTELQLEQLKVVLEEMVRCYGRINSLNDDVCSAKKEMTQEYWQGEVADRFGEVVDGLSTLNIEALEELKVQIAKLAQYVEDLIKENARAAAAIGG